MPHNTMTRMHSISIGQLCWIASGCQIIINSLSSRHVGDWFTVKALVWATFRHRGLLKTCGSSVCCTDIGVSVDVLGTDADRVVMQGIISVDDVVLGMVFSTSISSSRRVFLSGVRNRLDWNIIPTSAYQRRLANNAMEVYIDDSRYGVSLISFLQDSSSIMWLLLPNLFFFSIENHEIAYGNRLVMLVNTMNVAFNLECIIANI